MSDSSEATPVNFSALPAHALYVELSTRISTQRLHYHSGDEETAAFSLHSLFAKTRKLMEDHPEATEFHEAALVFLNEVLRPYTARWHGWMIQDRESHGPDGKPLLRFRDEWVRRKFREELQPLLHGACKFLHSLSLGKTPSAKWLNPAREGDAFAALKRECESSAPSIFLGVSILLKIRPQVSLHGANEDGSIPPRRSPARLRMRGVSSSRIDANPLQQPFYPTMKKV